LTALGFPVGWWVAFIPWRGVGIVVVGSLDWVVSPGTGASVLLGSVANRVVNVGDRAGLSQVVGRDQFRVHEVAIIRTFVPI